MSNKISAFILILILNIYALGQTTKNSQLSVALKKNTQAIDNSTIDITLKNNTDKSIKILKWNTPFEDKIRANLFNILKESKSIQYRGIVVKRNNPTDKDYFILKPFEQKTALIDLSRYYKMSSVGEYKISYRGIFKYTLLQQNKTKVTKKNNNIKFFEPEEKFIQIYYYPTKYKRYQMKIPPNFDKCTQTNQQSIIEAHNAAINIAQTAVTDLNNATIPTDGLRYQTWFGKPDTNRQNIVTTSFKQILDALNNKQMVFSCKCDEGDNSIFGYVYPNSPYIVHLCSSFFSANVLGTDSKAGTIIHETSHFTIVAGTYDHVYGQDNAKNLAIHEPSKAINNADSYEYFAENNPFLPINNPFNDAMDIVLQQNITSKISNILVSNQTDYYSFNIPQISILKVWSEGNIDLKGKLFSKDRDLIVENDDDGEDKNFFISKLVKAGKKYIVAQGYDDHVTGNYDIYFRYNTPQSQIILNTSNQTDTIQANFTNDTKYYLILLDNRQNGYINISTKGTLDTMAQLYNNDLMMIDTDDDGGENNNFLIANTLQRGLYYLLINEFNSQNGSFSIDIQYTPKSINPSIILYLLN